MREPKLPRRGCDTLAWGCYFSVREGAIRLGSLGPTTRWRKAVVHCSGVVELNGRVGLVLTPQLTQGHGGVERDPHRSLTALHSQNSEFLGWKGNYRTDLSLLTTIPSWMDAHLLNITDP